MTLDEAIKHAEEVAEQNEWFEENYLENKGCKKCAEEHRQLALWLKEYKRLKEQEPCDDVVSRQAVLEYFESRYPKNYADEPELGGASCVFSLNCIRKALDELPSVRPQEQTGHWIMNRQLERRTCDNCNTEYRWSFYPHNFCPNCGARMVEPQETETWHGIHAQITAPKGTFERIFNEADDDNDI